MDIKEIKNPDFLDDLSIDELKDLSKEIREFIIDRVSKNGGHLSGNLGVVELTIALHKYFKGYKFIFDVGHQCYTHKILTGRAKDFDKLRTHNGLAGFTLREESTYDSWDVAHASTSLAAQAGFLTSNIDTISIIGDGALTGGEAIEALEYLSTLDKKAIIILNDNTFSISKNVGFIRKMLDHLRSSRGYNTLSKKYGKNSFLKSIKNGIKRLFYKPTVFDAMGFKYYGPIDGHNFKDLFKYFKYVDSQNRPVVLHVVTKKGKGYKFAEEDEIGAWHCVSPFSKESGLPLKEDNENVFYSEVVSEYLSKFYDKHNNLKVVMPAMTYSSNMVELKEKMKGDFIDTGITEEFATSFSASLAMAGNYTVLPIYSSFLQRAYDQIHQDVSLQNIHLVIVVDKAGLVSSNGKTHQGIYDISYLSTIPNLKIVAPRDMREVYEMLDFALLKYSGPIAIHIPNQKTRFIPNLEIESSDIEDLTWTKVNNVINPKAIVISYSSMIDYIKDDMKELDVEVYNARFIKPLDSNSLKEIAKLGQKIVVVEEAPGETSLYSYINNFYRNNSINVDLLSFSFPLDYIDIGSVEELRSDYKMDKKSIKERIKELL